MTSWGAGREEVAHVLLGLSSCRQALRASIRAAGQQGFNGLMDGLCFCFGKKLDEARNNPWGVFLGEGDPPCPACQDLHFWCSISVWRKSSWEAIWIGGTVAIV